MHVFLSLLKKDFTLDFRQKFALGGIFLYAFGTVFLLAYGLQQIKLPMLWLSLFWIILFFGAINAIAKSFVQESEHRNLYYHQLVKPELFIMAKICYNALLMIVLVVITFFLFIIFLPKPTINNSIFFTILLLGSLALSVLLTLISSIAAQTKNAAMLSAILSIPLLLPLLSIFQKLSTFAVNFNGSIFEIKEFFILIGLILLMTALSYILYPYICRD